MDRQLKGMNFPKKSTARRDVLSYVAYIVGYKYRYVMRSI